MTFEELFLRSMASIGYIAILAFVFLVLWALIMPRRSK